jgi:hypothetical protein
LNGFFGSRLWSAVRGFSPSASHAVKRGNRSIHASRSQRRNGDEVRADDGRWPCAMMQFPEMFPPGRGGANDVISGRDYPKRGAGSSPQSTACRMFDSLTARNYPA